MENKNGIENKNIMVVGGTGSLGHGLIKELLKQGVRKIKVYARNEFQMINLLQDFHTESIEPIIGDIRDRSALLKACKGCNILFHLAALKHVPICETVPMEAIDTNVLGTQNIIDCAMETKLEKVIYISTDKATNANCVYGCTKLLGEKLMLTASEKGSETKFIVFRSGNLLESAGSVIPLFKRQIEQNGRVTLTDDKMNRFFLSIEKASKMLVEVANRGAGGEIFLPAMPSLMIKDIAQYLLKKKEKQTDSIEMIGIRPGEKLNEQMLDENEMENIYRLNDDLYLICTKDRHSWIANQIIKKSSDYIYQSEQAVLQYEQAEEFLERAMCSL